ncbi:DUF1798 family protein [Bacillus sp. 1P06AnD]|uniref:DUF1798 family protein n=1 Tax=Bacillus sp. 1P06AnD TaxID=3132208 RepID=UPI00399F16B1
MEQAIQETRELVVKLEEMDGIYENARQTKEEYDFYTVIEPFANKVKDMAETWRESIEECIAKQDGYVFGERQLDQVVDNMCQLSVQAFQHKSSYKRFKSYVQSTRFLLGTLVRQLDK